MTNVTWPINRYPWRGHLVVTGLWAASVGAAAVVTVPPPVDRVALVCHLIGLVIGLGPIVLLDWYALVWLSGLRRFREFARLGEASHPIIWLGTLLLLASGAFLHPDFGSALTWLKMAMVLALLHNGIALRPLSRLLLRLGAPQRMADLQTGLRRRLIASFVVSQVSWWGALAIGFVTTTRRHGP